MGASLTAHFAPETMKKCGWVYNALYFGTNFMGVVRKMTSTLARHNSLAMHTCIAKWPEAVATAQGCKELSRPRIRNRKLEFL